jgi:hypothetical protein
MTVPISPLAQPLRQKEHAEKRTDAGLHVGHEEI